MSYQQLFALKSLAQTKSQKVFSGSQNPTSVSQIHLSKGKSSTIQMKQTNNENASAQVTHNKSEIMQDSILQTQNKYLNFKGSKFKYGSPAAAGSVNMPLSVASSQFHHADSQKLTNQGKKLQQFCMKLDSNKYTDNKDVDKSIDFEVKHTGTQITKEELDRKFFWDHWGEKINFKSVLLAFIGSSPFFGYSQTAAAYDIDLGFENQVESFLTLVDNQVLNNALSDTVLSPETQEAAARAAQITRTTAPASSALGGAIQAIGIFLVTTTILFTYAQYFNIQLNKEMAKKPPSYVKDGVEIKYDSEKYDNYLADQVQIISSIMNQKVWDIEFGPGGSGDKRGMWKRDDNDELILPEEFTSYCNSERGCTLKLDIEEDVVKKEGDESLDPNIQIVMKQGYQLTFKIKVDYGTRLFVYVPVREKQADIIVE